MPFSLTPIHKPETHPTTPNTRGLGDSQRDLAMKIAKPGNDHQVGINAYGVQGLRPTPLSPITRILLEMKSSVLIFAETPYTRSINFPQPTQTGLCLKPSLPLPGEGREWAAAWAAGFLEKKGQEPTTHLGGGGGVRLQPPASPGLGRPRFCPAEGQTCADERMHGWAGPIPACPLPTWWWCGGRRVGRG